MNNLESAIAQAEVMPEEECNAEFKIRQTHHELVSVDDGESNEDSIFTERCAVYRFDPEGKEWKERGRGDVKLLKHKETGRIRIVMRQEKTLYVRLNHYIPDITLTPNGSNEKAWSWRCVDYATDDDEPKTFSMAVRFSTVAKAQAFYDKWEEARKINIATEESQDEKDKTEEPKKDETEASKEDKAEETEKSKEESGKPKEESA